MLNRIEEHHRSPREVPTVGRPRGSTWRSLQADGVVWEGQVLLVGGEVDLAARMIVTHRRVAFVRGGEIVLEIPRGWLRQEPVMRRDGILELFVATPDSDPFDEPMHVPLRMRDGHPAAGHIIAMLAPGGVRRIAPEAMSAIERAREASPSPSYGGFWDGVEGVVAPKRDGLTAAAGIGVGNPGEPRNGNADLGDLAPMEPPDRLVRVPSSPQGRSNVNAFPIAGMRPRDQRRSPWTLLLGIAALTILLSSAAALGAGRLNLRLPGSGLEAVLTAPSPTATAPDENATETAGAVLTPDELTAVPVGVGGEGEAAVIADPASESVAAAATEPAAVVKPTKAVIPTPAPATTASATLAAGSDTAEQTDTTSDKAESPAALAQATAASTAPTDELMIGTLRLSVANAMSGESLPKYGLPPGSGEWVLVMADLQNEGDAAESLSMSDIRLVDRGTGVVANLDSGTDVIASLAGMKPARGADDVISIEPGGSAETLLLYLLPDGSGDELELLVGQSALELAPTPEAE